MQYITVKPLLEIAQVSSMEPTENFSNIPLMRIGRDDPLEIYRILIKFPITSIPSEAAIMQADLKLFMQLAGAGQQPSEITPYALTGSWVESTVTWNNQPLFNPSIYGSSEKAGYQNSRVTFDITSLVQKWYNNDIPNYGIVLKNSETKNFTLTNVQTDKFSSTNAPLVEISYALSGSGGTIFIEGLEEFYTNSSYSYSITRNTSLIKTLTYFIKNIGLYTVTANIQISPDGVNFIDDPGNVTIAPNSTQPLVPYLFAKYTRIRVKNINALETSRVRVWYQAQQ